MACIFFYSGKPLAGEAPVHTASLNAEAKLKRAGRKFNAETRDRKGHIQRYVIGYKLIRCEMS